MDLNNTANRVIGAIVLLLIFYRWLVAYRAQYGQNGHTRSVHRYESTAGNTTNATNTGTPHHCQRPLLRPWKRVVRRWK